MKPDERAFFLALWEHHQTASRSEREFADKFARRLGMHSKRCHYLLGKWTDRGLWSYGITARSGWFEPRAAEFVAALQEQGA